MSMMFDTPKDIHFVQMASWKAALSIQYKTGLGHSRGSVPKLVANYLGMKYRTRKDIPALIDELQKRMDSMMDAKMSENYEALPDDYSKMIIDGAVALSEEMVDEYDMRVNNNKVWVTKGRAHEISIVDFEE